MSNLTGTFEQYRTPDTASDLAACIYCGNYSAPLKRGRRNQIMCVNFAECVWNRVENGTMTEARAFDLTRPKEHAAGCVCTACGHCPDCQDGKSGPMGTYCKRCHRTQRPV